jgi:hypothetical protein
MDEFPRQFFLCHATENKKLIVEPLYRHLADQGYSVWYDEAEIKWGDSITAKVNWGLANSRFVIVVLSAAFLKKHWPNRELNAALNAESTTGQVKVLPLLVGTPAEKDSIVSTYPLLNDKRYLTWEDGNFDGIGYELSRLVIVPKHAHGPERILVAAIEAKLEQARVPVASSPLRSLATSLDVGYFLKLGPVESLTLDQVTLDSLSDGHRRQFAVGYLHEVFLRLQTLLPRAPATALALIEIDGALLGSKSFAALLAAFADSYEVSRNQLGLIFAESIFSGIGGQQRATLLELVKVGFTIGLSEFGSGYSSLADLRSLPIKYIVADSAFSESIGHDSDGEMLLATIGSLCKALNVVAVGCGISSEGQIEFMKKARFDLVEWVSRGNSDRKSPTP